MLSRGGGEKKLVNLLVKREVGREAGREEMDREIHLCLAEAVTSFNVVVARGPTSRCENILVHC